MDTPDTIIVSSDSDEEDTNYIEYLKREIKKRQDELANILHVLPIMTTTYDTVQSQFPNMISRLENLQQQLLLLHQIKFMRLDARKNNDCLLYTSPSPRDS